MTTSLNPLLWRGGALAQHVFYFNQFKQLEPKNPDMIFGTKSAFYLAVC